MTWFTLPQSEHHGGLTEEGFVLTCKIGICVYCFYSFISPHLGHFFLYSYSEHLFHAQVLGINDGFSKLLCPWEAESLLRLPATCPNFFARLRFHKYWMTSYYIPSILLSSTGGKRKRRWRKGDKETKFHNHRNSLEREREIQQILSKSWMVIA